MPSTTRHARKVLSLVKPLLVLLGLWVLSSVTHAQPSTTWANLFAAHNATGTLVVLDNRDQADRWLTHNPKRANTPLVPASTYKIPHALFALDAGIVSGADHSFEWDGIKRSYAPHNQDQTLATAMRFSTVWVFEQIASVLGETRAQQYLDQLGYGNRNLKGPQPYWIEGELAISTTEQVEFLQRLEQLTLPFPPAHQALVAELIHQQDGQNWQLFAKTGWSGTIGWWVGWVLTDNGPVYFALNIDTPNRAQDLPLRKTLVIEALQAIEVLPTPLNPH